MFFNKKRKHRLDIEEIFAPAPSSDFLEISLTGWVFRFFYLALVFMAFIFLGRVTFLWLKDGGFYANRAKLNANEELISPALRGIIFDRFMKPLAQNQPIFSVTLNVSEYLIHQEEIERFLDESIGLKKDELDGVLSKVNLEKTGSVTMARDLEPDQLLALKSKEIPGLQVSNDFRRFYPVKYALSHILGYSDSEGNGRTGLELAYENDLHGEDGAILRQRSSKGVLSHDEEVIKPVNGKNLVTTVDADFQEYFYNRLLTGLNELGKQSGAGLAIDPRNGEILAAISFPSFDNNLFTKKGNKADREARSRIMESKDNPLFTRFVSGAYNPGSTIKPLVATAALNENVIDTTKSIFSKGYIEIPNPYFPDKPSVFKDWKPNGWVNLYSALARSSNIYFYAVGGGFEDQKGLGINKLIDWWKKFGLGSKTGIDFPGEASGFLPNPDEKEKRTGMPWRIGDTYNVSIGQGDLLVTPLQLVNYVATIANGGKLYLPHINKNEPPKLLSDLTYLKDQIAEVHKGMEDVTQKPYGTAYSLSALPFKVAAKTGTAQIDNNTKTNAFFVGFAPVSDDPALSKDHREPEIAIMVLVENSKDGSLNTIPIAKDVLNWYYKYRLLSN